LPVSPLSFANTGYRGDHRVARPPPTTFICWFGTLSCPFRDLFPIPSRSFIKVVPPFPRPDAMVLRAFRPTSVVFASNLFPGQSPSVANPDRMHPMGNLPKQCFPPHTQDSIFFFFSNSFAGDCTTHSLSFPRSSRSTCRGCRPNHTSFFFFLFHPPPFPGTFCPRLDRGL